VANPNELRSEMRTQEIIDKIIEKKQHHGIRTMLWMGGEPLLRPDVLAEGVKHFEGNTVTTNGTLDLIDLPRTMYVVSIDGPPEINDAIRGKGAFEKVMTTLKRVPDVFEPRIFCQCVVTKENQGRLEALVPYLLSTPVEGLTFSFYVPSRNDTSDLTWGTLKARDDAVYEVMRIKHKYPDIVRNHGRSLELMLSDNAKTVTDNCPAKRMVLPLYLEADEFVTPFCCYGNDVDCDLCGAWVVFHLAALMEKR